MSLDLNTVNQSIIRDYEVKKLLAKFLTEGALFNVVSAGNGASSSFESLVVETTLTAAGAVGGRARFELDTNVALGSWANALKAQLQLGASGKVTGLGSAFVAELILSAGATDGNYAPLELELGMPSGALTGTATAMIYASLYGADAATFDTNGYILNLAGVTVAGAKVAATGTITNVNEITHGLRVKIAGSDYYLLAATVANFNA
jgi:hypothetical protein